MDDAARRAKKAAYMREWSRKNPDRVRAYKVKRRAAESIEERTAQLAYYRQWQKDHPGYQVQKVREWRKAQGADLPRLRHEEYLRSRDKILAARRASRPRENARRRERYATDPEYRARVTRRNNANYANDPDKRKAAVKTWRKNNRALVNHAQLRRRRRKIHNGGTHTLQEWLDKCALFGQRCAYCGESKPLTRDHDLPLLRGGDDSIHNILPACRSCNVKKGRRTASEYLALKA